MSETIIVQGFRKPSPARSRASGPEASTAAAMRTGLLKNADVFVGIDELAKIVD